MRIRLIRPGQGLENCTRVGAAIGAALGGLFALALIIALFTDLREVIGGRPNPRLPLAIPFCMLLGAAGGAIAGMALYAVGSCALRGWELITRREPQPDEPPVQFAGVGDGRWHEYFLYCSIVRDNVVELARVERDELRQVQLARLIEVLEAELPAVWRLARYGYILEPLGRLQRPATRKVDARLQAARAAYDEAAAEARRLAAGATDSVRG